MNTSSEQLLSEDIVPHGIEQEIKQSYISYAMSVIVSRALPDTRDGLKPVLRRILYTMYEMKLFHNAKHKKSMGVVGQTLRDYHPHGDSSVYEAMVRLAQPFALRYPLVDGQGNFGSIDGDGAAAARYTEARLTELAEEMLQDIELDTIDVQSNYDNSRMEPVMLPTKFPNHLCNGTMGIAVGMATNMAPHNLTEVIDASLLILENPDASIDEIMEYIKGPDFPTGGIIFNPLNIKEVYSTGHGGIVVRGKAHIEDTKNGKQIVITEIPYQVNKSTLVAKFGELVADKKLEGISDITDASNRNTINIILSLKKGVNADDILAILYKSTDLQTNFNLNNVTLIDKGIQPQLLNIRDLLIQFVDFRREVIYRRSVFLLKKAKDRLHILEGLKRAIDMIDRIIETIKSSATKQEAKDRLISEFDFSEVQAEYILQMRLQSLVGLEIQNVLDEMNQKAEQIKILEEIIGDAKVLDGVVRKELNELKNKYGDARRTQVSSDESVYTLGSQLKALRSQQDKLKESVILRVGNDHSFRVLYQSRINQIPDDSLDVIYTHNQDQLIVITDRGELVIQRLKDIGQHQMKSPALSAKEHRKLQGNVVFVNTMEHAYDYLIFLTDKNNLKKIKKELLLKFKKFPTVVMNLDEGERLMSVEPVTVGDKVGIISQQGMLLIFPEDQIRPSGKGAGGVKGIDLQASDQVAKLFLYRDEPFIMLYSDQSAKLINTEDCKIRKRARIGQMTLDTRYGEPLKGAISIVEGAVRVRLMTGNIITLHSNDIDLDDFETPLRKIVSGNIDLVYRPWEEKEENKRLDKSDSNGENSTPSQPELLS